MEYATKELERIANALEEILRLVKKDMGIQKSKFGALRGPNLIPDPSGYTIC